MQKEHTRNTVGSTSLSRRNFMSIAAAGSVAVLPIAALAEASPKTGRLPTAKPLTLDQQLGICVANLRNILAAMHPNVTISDIPPLHERRDGSFRFAINGDVFGELSSCKQ